MFFKKKEEVKEKIYGTTKMQKVSAKFTTVDGKEHYTGNRYKWCHADGLRCSVGEYIMIHIKDDGYIQDEYGDMYILQNVVSIKWNVEDELIVVNKTKTLEVWYTYEELEKMGIVK